MRAKILKYLYTALLYFFSDFDQQKSHLNFSLKNTHKMAASAFTESEVTNILQVRLIDSFTASRIDR